MKNDKYKAKDKIVPKIRSPEFTMNQGKDRNWQSDISNANTSKRNRKYQLQKNVEQEAEPQEGEAFFRGEQEPTRKRQRRITADEGQEHEGMGSRRISFTFPVFTDGVLV